MFNFCYSIISCCGYCPWIGNKIEAPNGAYVPVDKWRENKRIYRSSADTTGYSWDGRTRIYPKNATSVYSRSWRAVDNVDYSQFGFVLRTIPDITLRGGDGEFVWLHPDSRLARTYQEESGCLIS
jgi:hypothetical protein